MDASSTKLVQDDIILQSVTSSAMQHTLPALDVLHTARLLEAQLRSIETMCEDKKAQRASSRKRVDELDKLLTSLRALEQREKNTSLKLSKIWAKKCGVDVGRPGVMSVVQSYGVTPYMRQAPMGMNQDGVSRTEQETHLRDSIALFDGPILYRFGDEVGMTERTKMEEDKEDHKNAQPQKGDHLLDSTWRSPLPLLADAIDEGRHEAQQPYSISFSSSVNGSSQTNLLAQRPQDLQKSTVPFDSADNGNTKTTTRSHIETGPDRKRRKTFSDETEEKEDAGVQDDSTKSTKRSWKLRRGRA